MTEDRVVASEANARPKFDVVGGYRPMRFDDFIGQRESENLKCLLRRLWQRSNGSVLFHGPPGLGRRHLLRLLLKSLSWFSCNIGTCNCQGW